MRQRRGPRSGPILPLTTADAASSAGTAKPGKFTKTVRHRKRRRPGQLPLALKMCGAVCLMCLFTLVMFLGTSFTRYNDKEGDRSSSKKRRRRTYLTVTCSDGSTGYKDDDYCDCLDDGRDEPNTAACSYWLAQRHKFQCRDGSMMIFASRVADGVRDCPDGSDEHDGRRQFFHYISS
jgi:hypothetical protein